MKYEKFDLERALAGEAVILRNGKKAYVRYHEAELPVRDCSRLWGGFVCGNGGCVITTWSEGGRYFMSEESGWDIIGMYLQKQARIEELGATVERLKTNREIAYEKWHQPK